MGKWIKAIWQVYIRGYKSAIKKEDTLPFAAPWTNLEAIMLR